MQKLVADALRTRMLHCLERKPEIADFSMLPYQSPQAKSDDVATVIPHFSVGCRRITPGPGYLEALLQDNVIDLVAVRPLLLTHFT